MLLEKIFFSFILISVTIFDSAFGISKCQVKDGFDRYELEGTWNYIAGINSERLAVCGNATVFRSSRNKFSGSVKGSINNVTRRVSFQAIVRDGLFSVRMMENSVLSEEYTMKMKTCNGVNEVSFEMPNSTLYLIFSKDTSVTPIFLKHYRKLGKEINSKLRVAQDTNCSITPS